MLWSSFMTVVVVAVAGAAPSNIGGPATALPVAGPTTGRAAIKPAMLARDLYEVPKERTVTLFVPTYSAMMDFTPVDDWSFNYLKTEGFDESLLLAPNLTLITNVSTASFNFSGVGLRFDTNAWRSGDWGDSTYTATLATLTVDGTLQKNLTLVDPESLADTGVLQTDSAHTLDVRVTSPLPGAIEVQGLNVALTIKTNT